MALVHVHCPQCQSELVASFC